MQQQGAGEQNELAFQGHWLQIWIKVMLASICLNANNILIGRDRALNPQDRLWPGSTIAPSGNTSGASSGSD
jgi:hypothetical protein